ncbi:hypothetical protein D3C77_464820 [compost metagenome]
MDSDRGGSTRIAVAYRIALNCRSYRSSQTGLASLYRGHFGPGCIVGAKTNAACRCHYRTAEHDIRCSRSMGDHEIQVPREAMACNINRPSVCCISRDRRLDLRIGVRGKRLVWPMAAGA